MSRPRTGTFEVAELAGRTVFRGRLRLADGSKSDRFDLPSDMDERQARTYLAGLQAEEDSSHAVSNAKQDLARELAAARKEPHEQETCDAWFGRYLPTKECGAKHRRLTRCTWEKWISPVIGPKPMADLKRDDVEDVRDALDRALDAKRIRHSTARNVWGTLTGALKAAYAARDRSLRVHPSPLHFGLLPPKRGDSRQRPWLYPNEWQQIAASAVVARFCPFVLSCFLLRPSFKTRGVSLACIRSFLRSCSARSPTLCCFTSATISLNLT